VEVIGAEPFEEHHDLRRRIGGRKLGEKVRIVLEPEGSGVQIHEVVAERRFLPPRVHTGRTGNSASGAQFSMIVRFCLAIPQLLSTAS